MSTHQAKLNAQRIALPDIDALETIAAWKDDLIERIARTKLKFEMIDHDVDLDGLFIEVQQFLRCCRTVAWRPRR